MNRKILTALVMLLFIACAGLSSYSYGGINDVQQSLGDGSVQNSTQQTTDAQATTGQGSQSQSGVVMCGVLNVRNSPWGTIIGTVKQGAKLDITGKEGVWFKINYNGGTGYVHSGYIATSDAPASASDGYVNTPGSYLNVRSGAWGTIIGKLNHGASIEILGKSGDWYQIKYNGKEAYVHKDYISKTKPADAAAEATSSVAATGGAGFGGRPVSGGPVTSEYGPRNLYGTFHYGIDIGVGTGTPVKSLGAGTVVSAGWDYGGGNTLVIKYDNGYTSTYCHLQNFGVSAGQRVGQGQQVGHTNNTGAYTTGPHLHFAIKTPNGTSINPRNVPGVVI
ncbi:MAG TPA: peptidoglycan DD-metalloendopeptidase family protein [Candidatus Wallbacteria bacterium]|nr:peptidoglycan DD-metalloendopeptidase family protein [Candidatus Wallbacteria bacterium]